MKLLRCAGTLIVLILPLQIAGTQTIAGKADSTSPTAKERNAVQMMINIISDNIVSAAEAMPAVKYGFVPTVGEFKNVRSFGKQVKHLAATNYMLAAAALGQDPPSNAGDEAGPDDINTKDEILTYARGSYIALAKATAAIGDTRIPVRSSPISPFQGDQVTRQALITEALIHSYDHYGQMVEYLRMNGIIPPASRP